MLEIIQEILIDALGVTDIHLGTELVTLELDSLDVIEFIMAIEHETDIDIPDELFEEFKTIGDIVNYLERMKL